MQSFTGVLNQAEVKPDRGRDACTGRVGPGGWARWKGKVGRWCHFIMTDCVSPLPPSSGEPDTDTGQGAVTSLTSPLPLLGVHLCVQGSKSASVCLFMCHRFLVLE